MYVDPAVFDADESSSEEEEGAEGEEEDDQVTYRGAAGAQAGQGTHGVALRMPALPMSEQLKSCNCT
jgi:hypothetical protein